MVKGKVPKPDEKWPEFIDSWPEQHDELLLDPPEEQEVIAEDWKAVQGEGGERLFAPVRKTPQELREFVEGVIANRYFLSVQIPEGSEHLVKSIFLPLGLGALADWPKEELLNIGIVYGEYGPDVAPRSINGFPMFFSCHIMHKDDWALADAAIRKVMKAQGEALDGLENRETEAGETGLGRTEDTAHGSQKGEGAEG